MKSSPDKEKKPVKIDNKVIIQHQISNTISRLTASTISRDQRVKATKDERAKKSLAKSMADKLDVDLKKL